MMKLTKAQIEELYVFTRQHYVEYYDLQTELVDHISNGIEKQWHRTPQLSFKEALDKEFKKFGIFGFMDVIEQKQKAMNKRYWKILMRFVKGWFKIPKILTTMIIFGVFFLVMQLQYATYILMGSIFILGVIDSYSQYQTRKIVKDKKAKKQRLFMLEAMIRDTRTGFSAVIYVNIFNMLHLTRVDFMALNFYWQVLIAAIATLLCISFYITAYIMPQKAEELLEETYPEYKLAKNL